MSGRQGDHDRTNVGPAPTRVVAPAPAAGTAARQASPNPYQLASDLAGRDSILDHLEDRVAASIDDSAVAFVLLVGEPGMGKSRLIKELAGSVAESDPDARFLVGTSMDGGRRYGAIAELLVQRFGILPLDSPEECRDKIIAGVSEVLPADRVTEVAHLIAQLLRYPFPDSPVVAPLVEQPQQLEARTFIALRRFLEADCSAGPLILCLENLEQSGPDTINLLHYLVAGLSGSPAIIIGTATQRLFQRHANFGDCDVSLQKLAIGPLSADESEDLLRDLCSSLVDDMPPVVVEHARSMGGSPRAVYELVRLLLESGAIDRSDPAAWKLDRVRLAHTRLPATHTDVMAERVRVMPERDRDILQRSAAIGETFWLDAVVALLRDGSGGTGDPDGPTLDAIAAAGDRTRVEVSEILSGLIEREWLVEVEPPTLAGEREYRFRYPQLWSVVHGTTDKPARSRHHQTAGQWLALRPSGQGVAMQEQVARHLEQAGDARGAAMAYRRAADESRTLFANEEAIRLYSAALSCLGEADLAARIHLWHDLGSVHELKGDYEAALASFERMMRLAWVCAARSKAAVAFNKMGRVWRKKGNLKLSLEYLNRGLDLFEQSDDTRGIAGSLDDVGHVLYLLGQYDQAFEKVTSGLAKRGKSGDRRSIAQSLSTLGNIQRDRGAILESHNCHREALELRRSIGDRVGEVSSLNNLAVLAYERGNIEDARVGWEEALHLAEKIGALPLQATTLCNLGEIALLDSRIEEARRRLSECLTIARDIDDRRLQVESIRNLARLEHRSGDTMVARELAEEAHDMAASAGLRDYEGRTLLTLAEVHGGALFDAAEDEADAAAEDSRAATFYQMGVEVLREIGNELELARGLTEYGRHKVEHGEVDQGQKLLQEALEIFTRLGAQQRLDVEQLLAAL